MYSSKGEGGATEDVNDVETPDPSGIYNTAVGYRALYTNTGDGPDQGASNTGIGAYALYNIGEGTNNIGLGNFAGYNVSDDGFDNIEIYDRGQSTDTFTIRIGTQNDQFYTYIAGIQGTPLTGTEVVVTSSGQLGTASSSRRFKKDIQDMGSASEAVLALRPVTFRFKPEIDPSATTQYGLVAEEVEKISPDLVIRDASNQPYSVRYDAVNAMLLNEFRKQHEKVEEQSKTIAAQAAHSVEQQREIDALKARLSQVEALTARLDAMGKLASNR
jgi:hypothetical protein